MTDNAKEMLAKLSNFLEVLESARRQDNKIISVWSGDVDVVTEALAALRLSARQQASVEEIDQLLMGACSVNMTYGACQRQAERSRVALLAKYDIFEKVEG